MIRLPRRPARYLSLLALAVGALVVPAAPASAAGPGANLDCAITVTWAVTPPLSPQTGYYLLSTNGLTGSANCTGTVNGQAVTGTGRFLDDTLLHITACLNTSGTGVFVLKIPTVGGTQTVAGLYSVVTVDGVSAFTGDLTGADKVISTNGDCFTTPISSAVVELIGQIT
jgi:hypothetical protein